MKKVVVTVLATLVVLVLGAVAVALSGVVNVAATQPHSALVRWFLSTTMDRSVESRAEGMTPPADYTSPDNIAEGLEHYQEMCAGCHGAPGRDRNEIGQGLNPRPPLLARHKPDDPGEAYWVIANGVRMTGMPAFGPTHSQRKIWAIVGFLEKLPELSPEEYDGMLRKAGMAPPGDEPSTSTSPDSVKTEPPASRDDDD